MSITKPSVTEGRYSKPAGTISFLAVWFGPRLTTYYPLKW